MHRVQVELTDVVRPAGIRQRRHDHERAFLCFVLRGPYEEELAGRVTPWPATSVLLHPAGTRHADALPPGGRLFGVSFGSAWTSRLDALPRFDGALVCGPGGPASWLMARLRHEAAASGPCADLACEGLLLEVLSVLGRPRLGAGHDDAVRRAEEMARATGSPVGLKEISREAGVDAGILARAFRRRHGMSVTAYVRRARVEEACRLVAQGMELADVAAAAGFADQSHLTRIFKRVTGTTPAAYRRALQRR